jgi:hypothetical protein
MGGEHAWTLFAVALGWFLSEFGQYWRVRREDRRAIGRALSHILEVLRQVVTVYELVDDDTYPRLAEAERLALNASIQAESARVLEGSKFDEAVETVAGVDPLLAARLRNWGTYSISQVLTAVSESANSLEALRRAQPMLGAALGKLSELVGSLSWRHGIRTWLGWRTRRSRRTPLAAFLDGAELGIPARGRTRG